MTDLSEFATIARRRVNELPAGFVISEHPCAKYRWKGTYPNGWIKHNDRQFVEDYLFMVASGESS